MRAYASCFFRIVKRSFIVQVMGVAVILIEKKAFFRVTNGSECFRVVDLKSIRNILFKDSEKFLLDVPFRPF